MRQNQTQKYSDSDLIDLYRNGKRREAMQKIYRSTVNVVYRYVYSRVGNKEWTEDLVSETYLTLADVLENYNGTSKLQSFIIGIAVNKIRQFWDKLKKEKTVKFIENAFIIDESEEDDLEDKGEELGALLSRVLSKLPDNYREIINLRFKENLSVRQAAEQMNVSESNARVLQHRALKKAAEIAEALLSNKS